MLAAGALALAACSLVAPSIPEDPARELAAVPFNPQTIHQCGPAALATVLQWSGVDVTPESLAPQVYIPGRKGSLALELVAATRRAGRVPFVLAQDEAAQAVFTEVRAGVPVVVLQDLGAAWIRRWHFAVVIGVDDARGGVILRSGKERRRIESTARFLHSWERGGRWALLALPPGRLPATATPLQVVRALEDSAKLLPAQAIDATYGAALERWPTDPTILFATANAAYGAGRLAEARGSYERLLAAQPGHAAGRNNYANLLLDLGCPAAAADNARTALADLANDAGGDAGFRAAIEETLARATRPGTAPAAPGRCPPP
jgi:hypothetical protein